MTARKLAIAGSSDFIQLVSYDAVGAPKHFENLSRCAASGETVWVAQLPTRSEPDAYTNAQIEGTRVVAWSWSCYRVELNIESGSIENSIFTK